MIKIQNLACVPITINTSDTVVPIKKDILKGKKINNIFIYASDSSNKMYNPIDVIDEYGLANIDQLENINLYLNASNYKNEKIIQNLNFQNFLIKTNYAETYENVNIINPINQVLDFNNVYFNSKSFSYGSKDNYYNILIYFSYQTESKSFFEPLQINGSITETIEITDDLNKFILYDLFFEKLKGKKIKNILFKSQEYDLYSNIEPYSLYFDLIGKNNNRRLEHIPSMFFSDNSKYNAAFEPFEIDFEKSSIISIDYMKKIKNYKFDITLIY